MSDFDKDLAIAISLSLQDARATNSKDEPILIIDSSDDEDLPIAGTSSVPRNPGTRASKMSSSTKSQLAASSKALINTNQIIDLDSTLELGDSDTATEDEDDTATEDESDEDTRGKAFHPPATGKGKAPAQLPTPSFVLPATNSTPKVVSEHLGSALPQVEPTSNLSPAAAFRVERTKLEQERLARLKRRRPDLPMQTGKYGDKSNVEPEERPAKRPSPALSATSGLSSKGSYTAEENVYTGSFNISDKSGLFWYGSLRQTANKHASPSQDTRPVFRLTTDILPSPHTTGHSSTLTATSASDALSFAIVSSYSIDLPWLYSLFPPGVPVILVAQPGQSGRAEVHHTLPGWVRTSPELPGGRGCMHVKLMMLFYKTGRLRIVIPTANFVPYDWRDIENTVWLQDVPLRTGTASASQVGYSAGGPVTEGFAETLERILKALHVAPALEAHLIDQRASGEVRLPLRSIDELHIRWDWSRVTAYLVPSLAGKHTGWPSVLQVGHVALMKAIRDMEAANDQVKIECQGSSIGTYSAAWTNEFMSSARGVSPDTWLDVPKARRSKAPHPSGLKIIFPSLRTVDASVLGRPGGGTMFCNRKQWDASTFPKTHFFDSNSKRGKVLMHSKMILGLLRDDNMDLATNKPKAWLYAGSHNFTPSAWGNLSGSGFTPILNITNYELGIVMPLESAAQGDELACWQRPARAYIKGEDVPWMQSAHM